MGRRRALVLGLLAAVLACGGAEAQAPADSVGVARSALGLLLVNRPDGRSERLYGEGSLPLFEGDEVKTGPRAQALIEFNDGTRIALNEWTTFVIRPRPPRERGITRILKLLIGELWLRTPGGARALEIETPSAIAGIRGTELNLKVHESGRSELTVLVGLVQFGGGRLARNVGAGTASVAELGKRPTAPVKVDVKKATAWVARVVGPEPAREQPGATKAPAPAAKAPAAGEAKAQPGGDQPAAPAVPAAKAPTALELKAPTALELKAPAPAELKALAPGPPAAPLQVETKTPPPMKAPAITEFKAPAAKAPSAAELKAPAPGLPAALPQVETKTPPPMKAPAITELKAPAAKVPPAAELKAPAPGLPAAPSAKAPPMAELKAPLLGPAPPPGAPPAQQISRLPTPTPPPTPASPPLRLTGTINITPAPTTVVQGTVLRFSATVNSPPGAGGHEGTPFTLKLEGPGDWASRVPAKVPAHGQSATFALPESFTVKSKPGEFVCFELKMVAAGQPISPAPGPSLAKACMNITEPKGPSPAKAPARK